MRFGLEHAKIMDSDGVWSHSGRTEGGNYSNVTKNSSTGKLFAELEKFCEESQVPVCG